MTISQFLHERAKETYPEPVSEGHAAIIAAMCPLIAEKLQPGANLLDVGCGQGPALQWFTDHGFKPVGITPNHADIVECKIMGLTAQPMDMHDCYLMPDASTHCVFARHVLEHSPIPFYLLCEFHRLLKPGGVLYVEVPAPDTDSLHETNRNHYSVMGHNMWLSLIHRAGFPSVDSRTLNFKTPAGKDTYFTFLTTKP